MSSNQHPSNTPGKSSSDSGQQSALDRWSQRRLQRLNTEATFRDQRQGGTGVLSPPPTQSEQPDYNQAGAQYASQAAQPQQPLHQQPQPHPSQQSAYQASRSSHSNVGLGVQTQPISNNQRSANYPYEQPQVHSQSQQQYSPPDLAAQRQQQDNTRPELQQTRSFTHAGAEDSQSMSSSNNGSMPAPKAVRSGAANRQSVHNGLSSREGSGLSSAQANAQQQGVPSFNASVVPPAAQGQPYRGDQGQQSQQQQGDVRRATPQPLQLGEDMSEEDVNQLIKDHKELRKCTLTDQAKLIVQGGH